MPMSTTSPLYQEARSQVLATLRATAAPLVTKDIFSRITVPENINDLSTVLNLMIAQGDLRRGPKLKHEGSTKHSYELDPDHTETARPSIKVHIHPTPLPPEPTPAMDTQQPDALEQRPPITGDPLIAQLPQHQPRPGPAPFSPSDSARLRALADSHLFVDGLPDWSIYLHSLASRIDEHATP